MKKVSDILLWLDSISPFSNQETWDNSGLNVGSKELIPSHIYVALEVTLDMINTIQEGSLLIVHHPLIFKPFKNMIDESYPANILKRLIKKDIALIALHTNFDKSHFSRLLVERILGFKLTHSDSYIAYFDLDLNHNDCVALLKNKFHLDWICCACPKEHYTTAALISGSGTSMAHQLEVDCLLSGDMKYHDAMIAQSLQRTIFDIRHYESEKFFGVFIQEILEKEGIASTILEFENPFIFC